MTLFKHLILTAVLFVSHAAYGEQKEHVGNWEVHYIAFNSTFLTPEIAKGYGIVRSRYNGVVNISVLDKSSKQAQSLALSGSATNLLGVEKPLTFKQVTEEKSIYYLAVLPFRDQEQFRIKINLIQGNNKEKMSFNHKFYAE